MDWLFEIVTTEPGLKASSQSFFALMLDKNVELTLFSNQTKSQMELKEEIKKLNG